MRKTGPATKNLTEQLQETVRRQREDIEAAMEAVDSLVEAHLATGQTQNALIALEDTHPVGKELLVIDHLISNGRITIAQVEQ